MLDTPWIRVSHHQVLNAAGNPGIYSVVHFKNLAIGIVPVDEELNTWIVGQYRFPLEAYSWEIPEGGGKKELPPLESARRELLEETGIIASRWDRILEMHLSNSATDELAFIFLARDLRFTQAQPEENEVLRIRRIPLEEAFRMVDEGLITDAMSVAALLKIKLMLLEKTL